MMMKFWYPLILAAFCTTGAQAAWVVPVENMACTTDINEWGNSGNCNCPEATLYNQKIGQCMVGEPYPILVSGVLHSKNTKDEGITLETEHGTFKLIVKQAEMKKLQKVDQLYFEVEGEFVLYNKAPTIIVDRLSWLE